MKRCENEWTVLSPGEEVDYQALDTYSVDDKLFITIRYSYWRQTALNFTICAVACKVSINVRQDFLYLSSWICNDSTVDNFLYTYYIF